MRGEEEIKDKLETTEPEIKVSMIVPIHNSVKYIRRCLDSLVNQTLKEIEIIAVLDCPTDGTDKIVEEYAERYENIVLIRNKENLHIGNSRNEGLKIARGEYIGFSDHDDYCVPEMFEILYNKAKSEDLDMVCSPYIRVEEGKGIIVHDDFPDLKGKELINKHFNNILSLDILAPLVLSHTVIWNKIFRTKIIKDNSLNFIDTKTNSIEDGIFLLNFLLFSNRINFTKKRLYFHVVGINNTGGTENYRNIIRISNYFKYAYLFLERNHLYNKATAYSLSKGIQSNIIVLLLTYIKKGKIIKLINHIKFIRNSEVIKNHFKFKIHNRFYDKKNPIKSGFYKFLRLLICI